MSQLDLAINRLDAAMARLDAAVAESAARLFQANMQTSSSGSLTATSIAP